MFYILTASDDAYITNKIISSKFRATDANTGQAGTLDLFRLYDESSFISSGVRLTSSVEELSRLLVKFDYSNVIPLTSESLDLNHPSFKATLKLSEVKTGAPVPRDFNVVLYPLAMKFNEGSGRNVTSFSDVDAVNFVTSSYNAGSAVLWNVTGSGQPGDSSQSGVDYYISGTVGGEVLDFGSSQHFDTGVGDISLDVTTALSSSLANHMVNHGFRISFSGSDETDSKTRFVKRFVSRHSQNKLLVPQLLLTWDDSLQDRHLDLQFNVSSSLFLTNTVSGKRQNLVTDASLTEAVGSECITLRFVSGSGTRKEKTFTVQASQHTASTHGAGMRGIYSGTFNLSEFNTTFFGDTPKTNSEIELTEIWSTNDLTVGFYTGSIKIRKPARSASGFSNRRLNVSAVNSLPEYKEGSKVTVRIFIEDLDQTRKEKAYKLPTRRQSLVVDEAYYRLVDKDTGTIIVPFDKSTNSTRLSKDSEGMYISFLSAGLSKGRIYTLDLLLIDQGIERLIHLNDVSFMVV